MNIKPFPWGEAMAFGLGTLRLSPDAFWRMTPRELAAAIRVLKGHALAPFERDSFATLLMRYPDGRRKR